MSEKEWLKAIGAEEEGASSDASSDGGEVQTPKKRGGGAGGGGGSGGGRGGRKKGRGGGRGGDDDDDDDDEDDDAALSSGKKRKRGSKGGSGGGGGSSSMKKLQKKMKKLMEIVIKYQDQDGRVLSEPFMKLPSKKELPDYYEVIRRPVDIAKILAKIDSEKVSQLGIKGCFFKKSRFNFAVPFSVRPSRRDGEGFLPVVLQHPKVQRGWLSHLRGLHRVAERVHQRTRETHRE